MSTHHLTRSKRSAGKGVLVSLHVHSETESVGLGNKRRRIDTTDRIPDFKLGSTPLSVATACTNIIEWGLKHNASTADATPLVTKLKCILIERCTEWGHLHCTRMGTSLLGLVLIAIAVLRTHTQQGE